MLKRITTLLGTKIRQEFLLGGLIKGTQCEVMSKRPRNSQSSELLGADAVIGPAYRWMAPHQNKPGKHILWGAGVEKGQIGVLSSPNSVHLGVAKRWKFRVFASMFLQRAFGRACETARLRDSEFEITLHGVWFFCSVRLVGFSRERGDSAFYLYIPWSFKA